MEFYDCLPPDHHSPIMMPSLPIVPALSSPPNSRRGSNKDETVSVTSDPTSPHHPDSSDVTVFFDQLEHENYVITLAEKAICMIQEAKWNKLLHTYRSEKAAVERARQRAVEEERTRKAMIDERARLARDEERALDDVIKAVEKGETVEGEEAGTSESSGANFCQAAADYIPAAMLANSWVKNTALTTVTAASSTPRGHKRDSSLDFRPPSLNHNDAMPDEFIQGTEEQEREAGSSTPSHHQPPSSPSKSMASSYLEGLPADDNDDWVMTEPADTSQEDGVSEMDTSASRAFDAATHSSLKWILPHASSEVPQKFLPLPARLRSISISSTRSAIRGTEEWAPPRMQFIWQDPRLVARQLKGVSSAKAVEAQRYLCAGCASRVDRATGHKRMRKCAYFNKYFCMSCHTNRKYQLPGAVYCNWDFSLYSISECGYHAIMQYRDTFLFDLTSDAVHGRRLYAKSESLRKARHLRFKLFYFRVYMLCCNPTPASPPPVIGNSKWNHKPTPPGQLLPNDFHLFQSIRARFDKFPSHWFKDSESMSLCPSVGMDPFPACRPENVVNVYTMLDFLRIKQGTALQEMETLLRDCRRHIEVCQLCRCRGHFCGICNTPSKPKNSESDLIFPFDWPRVRCCFRCRTCHHAACFERNKNQCPKCQRRLCFDTESDTDNASNVS